MYKLLLTIILIQFFVFKGLGKNYIQYHQEIIQAEKYFLDGQPKLAIKEYKKIFTSWPKPFAKDCFIALQVACMINDTSSAYGFFIKCFETGVLWETVCKAPLTSEVLNNNSKYKSRISGEYEQYRRIYQKSLDTLYRQQILSMIEHEYYFRRRSDNNETITAEWMRVEDSNMAELVKIIPIKGFPGEKRIGIRDDQLQIDKDLSESILMLSSIPAHMFYHNRCGYQFLKNELMKAVENGELHPREYALMYEWSHVYFIRKNWDDKYHHYTCVNDVWEKRYNIYLEPLYYSKDIAKVNMHRAEIGICSIEHDRRKRAFMRENRILLYSGFAIRI